MIIGLDAIPLTETKTGVGHYTFELARALAAASPSDEFVLLYPSRYAPVELRAEDGAGLPANLRATRVAVGPLGRHWWSIGLPRHLGRSRVDLFHGTNYDVPLWGERPAVLTVHDLSAFAWPETMLARRARRLRRRLPLMARCAAHVITPTEVIRGEACERLGLPSSKVTVVPEAPRRIFRPLSADESRALLARFGVSENFILAVGTIEPRKNLATLLRTFELLARVEATPADLSLVLAGRTGWLHEDFLTKVSSSALRERIHFTGYVTDEELCALYSSCIAFVYPSLYEGFGLPPLEAMACGAPVVASRIGAHLEVLGEESASLFPPEDARALAGEIGGLLADEGARRRLSARGRERAARFTWERTARETLAVYEEVLKRAGGR
ncbi:MAG TPA: glycosyltransferase family 1 protein [Pyrinomonadaceae bacterium]|nr:glycosyltransferase family 1 protein [Pyrinomonadaceae bacterium]